MAELLHIEQKLGNRATALSGGEMQRVAIGRALVREPAVYLMDEPLSSLDAKLRAELRLELKRIQRELGTTILYVTHDQIEAMTMADRIGVMSEGVLIQLGAPREIYERPNSAYVASRLGTPAINLVPAELLADQSRRRRRAQWDYVPSISGFFRQIVRDRVHGCIGSSISATKTMCTSSSTAIRSSPLPILPRS